MARDGRRQSGNLGSAASAIVDAMIPRNPRPPSPGGLSDRATARSRRSRFAAEAECARRGRLLVFVAACLLFVPVPARAQPATVTILHFNDVYEITPVEAGQAGGPARLARFRAEMKSRYPDLITTLGGDFVSPSAIGTARVNGERLAGKQMVAVLNVLGVDWATFGNHEFDISEAALRARLTEATFRMVSSNVTDSNGARH